MDVINSVPFLLALSAYSVSTCVSPPQWTVCVWPSCWLCVAAWLSGRCLTLSAVWVVNWGGGEERQRRGRRKKRAHPAKPRYCDGTDCSQVLCYQAVTDSHMFWSPCETLMVKRMPRHTYFGNGNFLNSLLLGVNIECEYDWKSLWYTWLLAETAVDLSAVYITASLIFMNSQRVCHVGHVTFLCLCANNKSFTEWTLWPLPLWHSCTCGKDHMCLHSCSFNGQKPVAQDKEGWKALCDALTQTQNQWLTNQG